MGLLDGLEKLINEHGSAVILKERIALANDKYSALEQKVQDLQTAISVRDTKIQMLEAANQSLKKDNEQLTIQVQNFTQTADSHNNLIDEIKTNILVLLSKYDKPDTEQISYRLKAHDEITQFHLTELERLKMIHSYLIMGGPARWGLTHEGRKYLIENKLIS